MYETYWRSQDVLRGVTNVMIGGVQLPPMEGVAKRACLRAAMRTFFVAGMQPRVPALLDIFRDEKCEFFVFEAVEGESLLTRMQRTKQMFPEQDIIECCLQMIEVLEAFSMQQPAIVHGLINPENIVSTRNGQWFLINFSLALACNMRQELIGLSPSLRSPFTAPEFGEGRIDYRADMYSLLATAYYAVTGELPPGPSTRISPSLHAIFTRGLHPVADQRYQQLSDLYQALQALRSGTDTSISTSLRYRSRGTSLSGIGQTTPISAVRVPLPGDRQTTPISAVRAPLPGDRQTTPISAVRVPSPDGRREEQGCARSTSLSGNKPEERTTEVIQPALQKKQASTKFLPPLLSASEPEIPEQTLLPRPEELPPMQPGNDRLAISLWIAALLVCFLIILLVGK
jgi:serine/threonine protein kinase